MAANPRGAHRPVKLLVAIVLPLPNSVEALHSELRHFARSECACGKMGKWHRPIGGGLARRPKRDECGAVRDTVSRLSWQKGRAICIARICRSVFSACSHGSHVFSHIYSEALNPLLPPEERPPLHTPPFRDPLWTRTEVVHPWPLRPREDFRGCNI